MDADYREMYITLFRRVTDAICLLQKAQQETEEIYISAGEENSDNEKK